MTTISEQARARGPSRPAEPARAALSAGQVNVHLLQRLGVTGVLQAAGVAVEDGGRWRGAPKWRGLSSSLGGPGDALLVDKASGEWVHFGRQPPAGWPKRNYCTGDLLDLYAFFRCAGDRKVAFAWALDLLDIRRMTAEDRRAADAAQLKAKAEAEARARDDAAKLARLRKGAFALWSRGGVPVLGTPSDLYLAGRGVDLRAFTRPRADGKGMLHRPPGALRHGAAVACKPLGRDVAALLALVRAPDGPATLSVHRHYIAEVDGQWVKHPELPGREAKTSYCSTAGGIIPIWAGAIDVPLWKQAPGTTVLVTEGVEDGLTAALAEIRRRDLGIAADRPVVAAVSLSNLGNVAWPPCISRVLYWAQNEDNPQAEADRVRALERVAARGVDVGFWLPPPGVKDVNDMVKPKMERV